MAWDDNKSRRDELSSDEWDNHVSDQKAHSHRHEKGGADELSKFGDTTLDITKTTVTVHERDITRDIIVGANEGLVLAGPISGDGSISGDGRLKVI